MFNKKEIKTLTEEVRLIDDKLEKLLEEKEHRLGEFDFFCKPYGSLPKPFLDGKTPQEQEKIMSSLATVSRNQHFQDFVKHFINSIGNRVMKTEGLSIEQGRYGILTINHLMEELAKLETDLQELYNEE